MLHITFSKKAIQLYKELWQRAWTELFLEEGSAWELKLCEGVRARWHNKNRATESISPYLI
jgi:hypothetical protein